MWHYASRQRAMSNREVTPRGRGEMLDHETGEQVQSNWPSQRTITTNAETGELEQTTTSSAHSERRRRTFQVPKNALQNYLQQTDYNNQMLRLANIFNSDDADTEYYYPVSIEQKLLNETHHISPAVFIIPILFLFPFPAWLTVITILIELCVHMWTHKRNKHSRDSHLRYQSPLHVFTSQFCALCNSKRSMQKIGRLQDARALKVYSRKPKYCTYVKKVSVVT